MTTPATIRCLEERQVDRPISHLLWSPKMDIIAVGSVNNDISLYRLNWQRIWITDACEDKLLSLSWRPDGKVLAVGYDSGRVDLFDVESHVPVLSKNVNEPITFLRWSPSSMPKVESNDSDWEFLTKFPCLSKAFSYNPSSHEEIQNCRKLSVESSQSLLICGTDKGSIHFFVAGYLYIGFIDMGKLFSSDIITIRDAIFAPQSMSSLVVLSTNDDQASLSVVKFPMIAACFSELYALAEKQSILQGTMDYMEDTLKQISEAWETILLEMDNKLSSYSKQMPDEHGMSADFLELLVLGVPSPELEHFLLQELGEKGLKKLGHSIEVSYSNVQRLVLKYLHTVSQALNFHLAEVMGDLQASDKYGSVIKIDTKTIAKAQKNASAFWAKGLELQQVIDESMKCFKAFFRWLYVEILRLSDENVSEDLSKASQQDVEFIAEFLENFSNKANKENESSTYLERVGQYMKDEPLVQLVDRSKNPWHTFLKENQDLLNLPEILVVDESASLIQAFHKLQASITDIFSDLQSDFSDIAVATGSCHIQHSDMKNCHFSQIEQGENEDRTYGMILWSGRGVDSKALCFEFDSSKAKDPLKGLWISGGTLENTNSHHFVGGSFYTCDTISVLLESNEGQRLIQLPVASFSPYYRSLPFNEAASIDTHGSMLETLSIFSLAGPAYHREPEGLNADKFSVSGPRKVAAFLFKNKKRIRIYDMEIEEEDDDDGDTLENSGFSSELNTSF